VSRGVVQVVADASPGTPARRGADELCAALRDAGYEVRRTDREAVADQTILVAQASSALFQDVEFGRVRGPAEAAEAYALRRATLRGNPVICIIGSDDNGVKYGCFELAEQVEYLAPYADLCDAFTPKRGSPAIAVRRLYTFLHNADLERDWYYSEEFWDGYLSLLARSRYNEFNLVFGHQTAHLIPVYAHMFELDGYPDVRVEGLTDEERARNLSALQMISRMATERGIDFWIGIWQSKPWAGELMGGQQARVRGLEDVDLAGYTLQGIVRLLTLCPDIAGIQLRMNPESGLTDQTFFRDVFIPGLKECGRDVQVEIRNWGLKKETLDRFVEGFPGLRVSFKYFAEHQAMPYQPVEMRHSYSYDSLLRKDRKYDVAWHVWNLGTHRLFVWGDPDYVKTFVGSCRLGDAVGFEVTPPLSQKGFSQFGQTRGHWSTYREGVEHDCYEWEYEKYWFFYRLWGRIAYDPELGDEVWLKELARRFGPEAAPHLLNAYRESSKVVSYLVSHHMDDRNMYNWLELDAGGPIDYFSGITPGEKTLFLNARDYSEARARNVPSAMITPFQAAQDLEGFADRCEAALEEAEEAGTLADNREYHFTSLDMRALCRLARYNACKIRASAYLSLFYETSDYSLLEPAHECARAGVDEWRELVRITEPYYERLQLGPSVGHWKDNLPWVEYDVRRIEKAAQTFRRYGIFLRGFDFGPRMERSYTGHGRKASDYDLVEPRFTRVAVDDPYRPQSGHGWQRDTDIRATGRPAPPLNAYRGTHLPGTQVATDFPAEFLYFDFARGTDPARFRVDVPQARYLLTFIVGDVSDEPAEHGAMSVSVNGTEVLEEIEIPVGDIREEQVVVEADDAGLTVDLMPTEGSEWVLNGLVVRELNPQIGHLPVYNALKDEDLTVSATVTSHRPLRCVSLFYRAQGEPVYRRLPMQSDGRVWRATIPGGDLTGEQAAYYIAAEDADGDVSSFPPEGEAEPIPVLLADEFSAPAIVEHEPPSRHSASEPLRLSVKLTEGSRRAHVRLHYRTVDQNADFKTMRMQETGAREYAAVIPAADLDPLFDEMYYFEALDRYGSGTFYPDPFTGGRYLVVRITR